ncbi:hypothetical protein H0H87_010160, partial [Tephrocybe sp. NHM501043]
MGRRPSPTASKQSKGTRTISPEQEKAIERAHLEFKSGVFKHVSEAAQAHDVPEEGLQMCQEERAAREEKERQKQEKQSRKDALNKENLVRRANHSATMVFTGALTINGKNKAELGDIAAAL